MRCFPTAPALLFLFALAGCHSAYINAVVENRTAQPISLVEVDYPSASFGVQTLAPGADFHYRFKVLGSGKCKLLWTDAARKDQHSDGPELKEGDEGSLTMIVVLGGADWVRPVAIKSERAN